ncbi:tryptophan-rich sensory protein [bacterium]|nr:tryptophan-rich sensory protein [bacterium]
MFYTYDDEFFNNIIKPALVPPKWVFRYVWTILFLLMFAALIIIMTKPASLIKYFSIGIFFLQLAVNLYWTKVFFKEHNIKKALAVAILLTVLVFVMIIFFFKLSFLAGFLLLPYLFWLGFACILNKLLLDLNK